MYRCPSHLSMLQRVQSGVVRCADDLGVPLVGRRSESRSDVVTRQTLGVTDGVILPGVKGHAVQRSLQDPVTCWGVRQSDTVRQKQSDVERQVTWPWRVGCFDNDVGNLKNLRRQKKLSYLQVL